MQIAFLSHQDKFYLILSENNLHPSLAAHILIPIMSNKSSNAALADGLQGRWSILILT